jgi:hypothetical protein
MSREICPKDIIQMMYIMIELYSGRDVTATLCPIHISIKPSRRHLLSLPIEEPPPILNPTPTNDFYQLLRRELRAKQLPLFHIPPELLAELRLDRTRM